MSQPLKSNHALARTAPLDRVNDQKAQRFAALVLFAHLSLICVTRMELSCISLFRLMRVRIGSMTKQRIHEQLAYKCRRLLVRQLTDCLDRPHFSVAQGKIHSLIAYVFRVCVHVFYGWLVGAPTTERPFSCFVLCGGMEIAESRSMPLSCFAYRTRKNIIRAFGMPFFFQLLTLGNAISNMFETFVVPPSRSIICSAEAFMCAILAQANFHCKPRLNSFSLG